MKNRYDDMWARFESAMNKHQYELDQQLLNPNDTRRGITCLAYLNVNNANACDEISHFLRRAQAIEPEQYFYPVSELHLTILSIISCYSGFVLSDIDEQKYIEVFHQALSDVEPIEIQFRGISASPNCVMIQGFPVDSGLNELRQTLREKLKSSGLTTNIDSRYKLITAHCSAIRFCQPLQDCAAFLEYCREYREHDFGTFTLKDIDLVFNNWYQNASVTQTLSRHSIQNKAKISDDT